MSKHVTFAGAAAIALVLAGCNSEERQLKAKAQWLCRYALNEVQLDSLPDSASPGDYIDPEDLEALRQKSIDDAAGTSEIVLTDRLRPALKAALEARAKHTTCTVLKTAIAGDKATVQVQGTVPVTDGAMEKVQTILSEPSHQARVAMAEKWFAAGETREVTRTMDFVKTSAGWRRHYGLKVEFASDKAVKEIDALMLDDQIRKADVVLAEAIARDPGNAALGLRKAMIQERLKEFIAGDWRLSESKDPMTDDRNVYVRLPAVEEISTGYSTYRPMLLARCAERELEMFVKVGATIDSDYGELYQATARIRFGDDPTEKAKFTVSDSHDAVFFRGARGWVERLQKNETRELLLEVPVYGRGRQVIRFGLGGAKKALDVVTSACPHAG